MKTYSIALVLVSLLVGWAAPADSPNGRQGVMDAYYDDELFIINFKEIDDNAADALQEHNKSINFIFMSDEGLPDGSMFVAVIDAIQGDGFNPLWVELQVHFTPGHTARQLTGDEDIADALTSGEISLETTGELYRCSVIGPKE
jgi:hypothetical protein